MATAIQGQGQSVTFRRSNAILKLAVAVACLSLVGCASTEMVPVPTKRPVPQQSLLMPCQDLPAFENRAYTQGEVVEVLSQWISYYKLCSYKQEALAKFCQENSE